MKINGKKVLAVVLALAMCICAFASCKTSPKTDPKATKAPVEQQTTPLVVAYDAFSEKFSPFFADTAYDIDVSDMTMVSLLTTDRAGGIVYNAAKGEKIAYNGTDYTYTGIADVSIDKKDDGTTVYKAVIKPGVKFSDGKELTADDVIFTYYVFCDPAYVGSTTLSSYNIIGLQNYMTQTTDEVYVKYSKFATDIYAAGRDHAWSASDGWTEVQQTGYWKCIEEAWKTDVQAIVDYCISEYTSYVPSYMLADTLKDEEKVAFGMRMWGFGSFRHFAKDAAGMVGFIPAESGKFAVDGEFMVQGAKGDTLYNKIALYDDNGSVVYYVEDEAGTIGVNADGAYVEASTIADYAGKLYRKEAYTGDRYTQKRILTGAASGKTWDLDGGKYPVIDDYYNECYISYDADPVAYWSVEAADDTDVVSVADSKFILEYGSKDESMGKDGIPNISGIKKLDKYTVEVTTSEYAAPAIYSIFGLSVAPLHYYGDAAQYDYENNKFGHPFNDLKLVQDKTRTPMGAGAYKFIKYENKVVYFEANDYYYKGRPIIKYIQFKETIDNDKISAIKTGAADISSPSGSKVKFDEIRSNNSNGELNGNIITISSVDNLGYGYIGINADTIKIGTDGGSEASKNFRRGFATLFAVYRELAIASYYGDAASVIQYPISDTSWAAPRKSDADYKDAFSVDIDGKAIYTEDMTQNQKYDAALKAAIGFFKAAGCTFDEASGKFTAVPDGAKMDYEALIPGDGTGDHPNFGILTDTSKALATIGFTLKVNDLADSAVLWEKIDSGEQEIWTAAWGATIDPDMYQVYHSSNIIGKNGSDSNHYHIADADLDAAILEARQSADQAFRKAKYKVCLDKIIEWACEIPSYQRQNIIAFSTERVDMSTVTPDITTYWVWMKDIELLRMVG